MIKMSENYVLKWNICRVCLTKSNKMVSIFEEDDNEYLFEKIAACSGIEIKNDGQISHFPDEICLKCLAYLNIAYKFRTLCKNSEIILRSLLYGNENESKFPLKLSTGIIDQIRNQRLKQAFEIENINENSHQTLIQIENFNEEGNLIFNNEDQQHCINQKKSIENITNDDIINAQHNFEIVATDIEDIEMVEVIENYEKIDGDYNEYYLDVSEQLLAECNEVDIKNQESSSSVAKEEVKNDITKTKNVRLKKQNINNINYDSDDEDRDKTMSINNENYKTKKIKSSKNNKKTKKNVLNQNKNEATVQNQLQLQNEFICEICGNKYKKKFLLDSHVRWHSEVKPYKCEVCGKQFTINFQLTRHMRVHTGAKPYSCPICDRKFSDYSTCRKHKRTHTNERPFKCEICQKGFNYSHVLKVHMTVHTGEKPYACDQCDRKFSQPHHLKAHLATLIHQQQPKIYETNVHTIEETIDDKTKLIKIVVKDEKD